MTNKEWLATLSAEDFYRKFKRAEEDGKNWTSTSGYVIQWLDEERRADEDGDRRADEDGDRVVETAPDRP